MSERRVLIVDDEPEMLENLDRLLSDEGYRCWTSVNSDDVERLLTDVRPDVLITDLHNCVSRWNGHYDIARSRCAPGHRVWCKER